MLAQAINFAIVFAVLYYFAFRPLRTMMDERSATIAGGLDDAKKQKELKEAQEKEYDAALAKARSEAAEIMKETKKEADSKRAELLEKAKAEAQAVFTDNQKRLEAEKIKMLEDAKRELADMVVTATERVLGTAVTGKVEKDLVEKSIKEI